MSEQQKSAQASPAATEPALPKSNGNPAFRAMGLPRIRKWIPSRNWSIFFTTVICFSSAVIYDRRQRKNAQQKWCNTVSHLSQEPLDTNSLPRKVTIYLAAPPGDGLRAAREHFQEYVKPVLVAAAVDWNVVEGRKEGDVRAALAKRIREKRYQSGENADTDSETKALSDSNIPTGAHEGNSEGDIVIGRHVWKEYIRGLHEGWLGPINAPRSIVGNPDEMETPVMHSPEPESDSEAQSPQIGDGASEMTKSENKSSETEKQERKSQPKPQLLPPYIIPEAYRTASLPSSAPADFAPSVILPMPHLLGFLNTPIRIRRFLSRRYLADDAGRQVASLLLSNNQSMHYKEPLQEQIHDQSSLQEDLHKELWEQEALLASEERDWHKSVWKANKNEETVERPWIEPMVIDQRIASRMKKPELVSNANPQLNTAGSSNDNNRIDDTMSFRGNSIEWKGGAARPESLGWSEWIKETLGLADDEPACKGWEQGKLGSEED